MINYVIYSNTDYLDVLQIQTDYMSGKGYLTLLLDKNEMDLSYIYSKYNRVIFYDKNDSYPKRVTSCLEQLDLDYILFIHDIDILIEVNDTLMSEFISFLRMNNFDRIDLKHSDKSFGSILFRFDDNTPYTDWEPKFTEEVTDGYYFVKQEDVNDYIYNVNPSIWKRESLMLILNNFQHKNYRNIEDIDVQVFAKRFKIFKIYSKYKLFCGYYNCLPFFKFLHISHSGKFLRINQNFTTTYGQSYKDISDIYVEIVDKYSLRNSKKWVM